MNAIPIDAHRDQPTWFRQRLAIQDRPFWSKTGDVNIYAGKRFPTSFDALRPAIRHARAASDGAKGAIAILEDGGRFHLSRAYNGEHSWQRDWELVETQLIGSDAPLKRFHPDLRALVDDNVLVQA